MSRARRSSGVHWPLRLQDNRGAAAKVRATIIPVDLTKDVTGDLPLANLVPASAAARLLGRGAGGGGDYEEITLGAGLAMVGATLSASGSSQVDSALVGNQVAYPSNATLLRANNAALLTIQGIAPGVAGQRLTIASIGAGQVNLSNEAAAAAAGARLTLGCSSTLSLSGVGGAATFEYDATAARWRLVHHDQGQEILVPFNAADFSTPTVGASWTVAAGNVGHFRYRVVDRSLHAALNIFNSSTAGSPAELRAALPAGLAIARDYLNPIRVYDGSMKVAMMTGAAGYLSIVPFDGPAFGNVVGTFLLQGQIELPLA